MCIYDITDHIFCWISRYLKYIDNNILQYLAGIINKGYTLVGSSHSYPLNQDCGITLTS